jgi:archaemetzincin
MGKNLKPHLHLGRSQRSIAIALILGCGLLCDFRSTSGDDTVPLRSAAEKLGPLHHQKQPPGLDDWLANHKEAGQTFEEYRRTNPNRPTRQRTTLYVQPIGQFSPLEKKLVGETADLLSRFYHVPTKVLSPLELDNIPASARRTQEGEQQLLTSYLLEKVLKPKRPANAVAVLGLTTSDLWPGEGWNFLFGQASLSDRVGIWSVARFGKLEGSQAESQQFRRRTFMVALHETGHMLGISHCTAYECLMNGSNHLAEMDARPMALCPECVQKVWWACHVNAVKRYEALAEFGNQHGLETEAEFWTKSADLLRNKPTPKSSLENSR